MADLKAKRVKRSAALAASADFSPGDFNPDVAPIRILYRGIELVGEVVMRPLPTRPVIPNRKQGEDS